MLKKYLSCMFGLAIGDAFGASIEFLSFEEIRRAHGTRGITRVQALGCWGGFPPGSYTYDTQMSLATGLGLIEARLANTDAVDAIYRNYRRWREGKKILPAL